MSKVSTNEVECQHCGTPFTPTEHEPKFCCNGCRYVHQVIHNKGLDQFYDLKNTATPPVGSTVFHPSDLTWLEEQITHVENENPSPQIQLEIQGISCVGCVWLIERIFKQQKGARRIRVMPNQGKIQIIWERGVFDPLAFVRETESLGYRIGPLEHDASPTLSPLLTRLGLTSALALNTMLFSLPFYLGMERDSRLAPLFVSIAFLLATASMLVGGSYFFRRCWVSLQLRQLHIDLPISIGLLTAYTGSVIGWATQQHSLLYFDFVAVFTALMLAGRYLQERAIEKNRQNLLSTSTTSQRWQTWRDGKASLREAEELECGDKIIIRPGQIAPVHGTLQHQPAMIGLDWITGESKPFLAQPGTVIPAGAVNVSSSKISILASESWKDSPLRELIEISEQSFAPSPLLEKVIRIYLTTVLILATAGAAAWMYTGASWHFALQVAISVLVVSCPCAIGIALPLADELAVKSARNFGVFVRESSLWHRLKTIRTIVFDKTGTVTLETPALSNEEVLNQISAEERKILLSIVNNNPHPISKALREALLRFRSEEHIASPEDVIEIPGSGLEWKENSGVTWRVGKPKWALDGPYPQASADCVFTRNGRPVAQFNFTEEIRLDAHQEIKQLLAEGFDVFLLSGDQPRNVQRMAALLDLPIENGIGGKTPDEKAEWIRLRPEASCMMVGDGANDSLAFNAAHCRATPAVHRGLLEHKSDFYFLGKSLLGIRQVFRISKQREITIRRVLIFTISYNLIAVGCALAGWINPLVAAIIMPISSILSLVICSLSQLKDRQD